MSVLTHITPRFPPDRDAVGQCAKVLMIGAFESSGMRSRAVVCTSTTSQESISAPGIEVDFLPERSLPALLNKINGTEKVVLHYVGYGFAEKGCPEWLVRSLELWKGLGKERQLCTIFHELYAGGAVWTTAFWLRAKQKALVRRLAQISDVIQLSGAVPQRLLADAGYDALARVQILPILSCIGECSEPRKMEDRCQRAVVFGTPGRRAEVYRRCAPLMRELLAKGIIHEIVDIGGRLPEDIEVPSEVISRGPLESDDVCAMLRDARIGFIDYRSELLSKSAIFAAYCSHRLVSVVAEQGRWPDVDGLLRGKHYLALSDASADTLRIDLAEAVADSAYRWYQGHSLRVHTEALLRFCKS